mgnify:CR=1 FL=1|tara:strand:+ start:185 stop:337 length:153 start_codon:yes stop_codon:yes gene_type:complete
MTDKEVLFVVDSVNLLAERHQEWPKDYELNLESVSFSFIWITLLLYLKIE